MTAQDINLIEAVGLGILSGVLFATALWRRYPVRSLFTYGLLHLATLVGVVGAYGGWRVLADPDYNAQPLSFSITVLRGAMFVGLLALVWYEHSHRYVRKHCKDCPHYNP